MESRGSYQSSQQPNNVQYSSQMNPNYILTLFLKINFNITLPSISVCLKWWIQFKFHTIICYAFVISILLKLITLYLVRSTDYEELLNSFLSTSYYFPSIRLSANWNDIINITTMTEHIFNHHINLKIWQAELKLLLSCPVKEIYDLVLWWRNVNIMWPHKLFMIQINKVTRHKENEFCNVHQ